MYNHYVTRRSNLPLTWGHDGVLLREQLDDERLDVEEEDVSLGVGLVSPKPVHHQRKRTDLRGYTMSEFRKTFRSDYDAVVANLKSERGNMSVIEMRK